MLLESEYVAALIKVLIVAQSRFQIDALQRASGYLAGLFRVRICHQPHQPLASCAGVVLHSSGRKAHPRKTAR